MDAFGQQLIPLVLGAFLVVIHASPSDIGAFSNQNDLRNAVSSFAIPTETQYVPMDVWVFATINVQYMSDEFINRTEKAKYGEGKILNVEGKLVHITSRKSILDHTGCDKDLLGTMGKPIPTEPWIALIKRGECNFEDKVANVYRLNASGVIVYNDRDSINLDKMKIIDKEREITAVFTYKWVGEDFASVVDGGMDVNVTISEGVRGGRPLNNINRTSVLFVSISFIVLMIISLIWLVFYYVQRFRYLQTKDKQSRRLCNVAKRIISRIPTKSVKTEDKEYEADCCAICIEPYRVADVIRVLPCKHEYHKVCIDPWLLEHRTCPMCKLDILKHYGFVVSANQTILVSNYDPMIMISTDSSANHNTNSNSSTTTNFTAASSQNTVNNSVSVSIEQVVEPNGSSSGNEGIMVTTIVPPPQHASTVSTGTMTESRQITDV